MLWQSEDGLDFYNMAETNCSKLAPFLLRMHVTSQCVWLCYT